MAQEDADILVVESAVKDAINRIAGELGCPLAEARAKFYNLVRYTNA